MRYTRMSQPPHGRAGREQRSAASCSGVREEQPMFAPKVAKPPTKATASSTSHLTHQRSMLAARRPAVQEALLLRAIGNQAMLRPPAQRQTSLWLNVPG